MCCDATSVGVVMRCQCVCDALWQFCHFTFSLYRFKVRVSTGMRLKVPFNKACHPYNLCDFGALEPGHTDSLLWLKDLLNLGPAACHSRTSLACVIPD